MIEILPSGEARITSHHRDREAVCRLVSYAVFKETTGLLFRKAEGQYEIFCRDWHYPGCPPLGRYTDALQAEVDFQVLLDALTQARAARGDPDLQTRHPESAVPRRKPSLLRGTSYVGAVVASFAAGAFAFSRTPHPPTPMPPPGVARSVAPAGQLPLPFVPVAPARVPQPMQGEPQPAPSGGGGGATFGLQQQ